MCLAAQWCKEAQRNEDPSEPHEQALARLRCVLRQERLARADAIGCIATWQLEIAWDSDENMKAAG